MKFLYIDFLLRLKLTFLICILFACVNVFGQSNLVYFEIDPVADICSKNNDILKLNQIARLKVNGPKSDKWFFSYSIDGGAEIIANNNKAITVPIFNLNISIGNSSGKNKDYEILIRRAWVEGDINIAIDKDRNTRVVPVLALPTICVEEYEPVVKLSSICEYEIRIAEDSDYELEKNSMFTILSEETRIDDVDQVISLKVQWPNIPGQYHLSIQEFNVMNCISDKTNISVDCVDKITARMPSNYYACNGGSVVLKPTYDKALDFKFKWNNGSTQPSLSVSSEGDYYVRVTSASQGVNKILKTNFSFAPNPVIELDDVYYKYDNKKLEIKLNNDSSKILWSTGETSKDVIISDSGNFDVKVTSAYGCVSTKSFLVRNKSELFTIDLADNLDICKSEAVVIMPKKSILQQYTYKWSNGSTNSSIKVNAAGVYSVKITDSLGYVQTASVKVNVVDAYTFSAIEDEYIVAKGDVVAVSVASSNLKYKWSTGGSRSSVNISKSGSYYVEVTNATGCVSRKEFKVWNDADLFKITTKSKQDLCESDEYTLRAETDIDQVYSYKWSTGETDKVIHVKSAGVYSVTITDPMGFKRSKNIEIIAREYPDMSGLESFYKLEDKTSLKINLKDSDVKYLWSTGGVAPSVEITKSGIYYLELTNIYSCTSRKEFKVRDASDFFIAGLPAKIEACENNNVKLTPSLNIDQKYTFKWNTGARTKSIEINTSGEFSVEVKDAYGYAQVAKSKIVIYPLPIVDLGGDKVLWGSEIITIDAGAGAKSYKWNTGGTDQTIDVFKSGEYSVDVTSKYGCENKDMVNLVINKGTKYQPAIDALSSSSEDLVDPISGVYYFCQGDSLLLKQKIESGSVSGLATYKWTDSNSKEDHIYVTKEGEYQLTVFDEYLNQMTSSIDVGIKGAPDLDLGKDIVNSRSKSVHLEVPADGLRYKWSTGEISQFIKVSEDGIYSVEVTDRNGCTAVDEVSVTFFAGYPYIGLPNVFSPNNDGLNDKIKIIGKGYKNVELSIFNRLGVRVFYTTNPDEAWDGTYKGVMQDSDNYVYSLKITYPDGYKEVKSGGFLLLH